MDDLRAQESWTPKDDAFVREALRSLRADVDATPLPEPAFVRARGDVGRRRRRLGVAAGVAAAVTVVAALGFRGVTDEDSAPPPLPAGPRPSASASAIPSPSPTASPTGSFDCPASARPVATSGVPAAAAQTAQALMSDAAVCDEKALVTRFSRDDTALSFGAGGVAQWMSLPENAERYSTLATVLSLPPGSESAEGYVQWPKPPETDADWDRLVDSGLITRENVAQMQQYGGYTGWRVVLTSEGRVSAFIAGD